jgi:hypothetical protein
MQESACDLTTGVAPLTIETTSSQKGVVPVACLLATVR